MAINRARFSIFLTIDLLSLNSKWSLGYIVEVDRADKVGQISCDAGLEAEVAYKISTIVPRYSDPKISSLSFPKQLYIEEKVIMAPTKDVFIGIIGTDILRQLSLEHCSDAK